jgi:hypothetical protein
MARFDRVGLEIFIFIQLKNMALCWVVVYGHDGFQLGAV